MTLWLRFCISRAETGLRSLVIADSQKVPAGYSKPLQTALDGVPIGMDFLGRPFDEGRLITLAFAWEQKGLKRRWPSNTPPLPNAMGFRVSP